MSDLGHKVAQALLDHVMARPPNQPIEEAIREFAKRMGLEITPQKEREIVQAIAKYNN